MSLLESVRNVLSSHVILIFNLCLAPLPTLPPPLPTHTRTHTDKFLYCMFVITRFVSYLCLL